MCTGAASSEHAEHLASRRGREGACCWGMHWEEGGGGAPSAGTSFDAALASLLLMLSFVVTWFMRTTCRAPSEEQQWILFHGGQFQPLGVAAVLVVTATGGEEHKQSRGNRSGKTRSGSRSGKGSRWGRGWGLWAGNK